MNYDAQIKIERLTVKNKALERQHIQDLNEIRIFKEKLYKEELRSTKLQRECWDLEDYINEMAYN